MNKTLQTKAMNDTLQTIHRLRTIHGNFADREVRHEDLQTILNAAVRAANSSARQLYSIIVVEDKAVMKELLGYFGSAALVFCVDFNRLVAVAGRAGYPLNPQGIVHFVTGSTDTILAAQTATIAAKSLGIDSLLTNALHRGDLENAYRLLGLPLRHCFPLVALVLGYPQTEPEYQKGRLNGPGVIHWGRYHQATDVELDAIIAAQDDPQQHLGLTNDWAKEGFAHYVDWLHTKWMPASRNVPPPTKQMLELLNRAQFV